MMINIMSMLFTSLFAIGTLVGVPEKDATETVPTDKTPVEAVQTPTRKAGGYPVTVTAYTSEPRQTDDTPCISADGSDICVRYAGGEKICASNDHPMHSKLYVEGYGECTVRDRMNKRYTGTGRVDIYLGYDTPSAFQWGVRRVNVSRL